MHAALVYIKNDIITDSNNIFLRKVNVKPYVFDKMYMDKNFIEDRFYQIHQFSERKIRSAKFYSILFRQNTSILWYKW